MCLAAFAVVASIVCEACAGPTGTLEVEVSGEEAARTGFPVGDLAFVDGWSVRFDKILVHLADFSIADDARFELPAESTIVDLTRGDQVVWTFSAVPAQRWPNVGYLIARPMRGARRLMGVSEADAEAMTAAGTSFWLVGTATHPTRGTVRIDLALSMAAHMERCRSGRDGTDGIVVPASGTHRTQMTLHLDHLFLDSFRSEEPNLRFDAWAAAAGSDGVVTFSDLASQRLADLRGPDGGPLVDAMGQRVVYEPPTTGLRENTLAEFVRAQALTLGHFEGEGHCDYHDHDEH